MSFRFGHFFEFWMPCFERVMASLAQLVARRSHNPKVVSSILTGGMLGEVAFHKRL